MVSCSVNSLVDACNHGDIERVRQFLDESRIDSLTEEGESLLSAACSAGCLFLAEMILDMGASIEDRGHKDTTPLMEAANSGHAKIVKLLIDRNASVDAQTNQGNTPLILAAANGHTECVKLLLDAGANTEEHNESGHTALMEAASNGHVEVAKLLTSKGASINTHSHEFKESALTLACYKGQLEMVKFLLEAGADQEHKTDEMHTALMEASMDGHVEVARLLINSGAQVTMPAESFESPLTLAACGGHVELAMLLLERGANIEEVNDEGYTPLMEAAREGHEEMVALLLSQGADINAQTEETQETALTLACCGGFLDVVDFLIKAGAEISAGTHKPLMEASQEGHVELVKYLLAVGADVNAATSLGDTALMYACEGGHTEVADTLITHGANTDHEAEGGCTPLMKACRSGHLATVEFLISRGADVNKITTNGDQTPLSLACGCGHFDIVESLLAHGADPTYRLRDNSTMLIEAAKGGHTSIVQLLIDYPASLQARIAVLSPASWYPPIEVDSQTESNHDTALSVACAGGHEEVVKILLNRGSDVEHRDKKGLTPLQISAQAGHGKLISTLLNNGADLEAQSERTKDTALSLACSSGRYDAVEILLAGGANKEHRNVSDYTPLSLAASGGYVFIIKLLLTHGAEINSRTGSKLGISPLMLAAMNGHAQTVKLLLDMGSDINAQIETNRNTALTLACFQGRVDVVSLLLDRKANAEHRAKTGLTPLMEAASGGFVDVGKVLLDKGADVNAPPVPSSRDTALTIAADKGHCKFVELLLSRGAAFDVKNKKGNSPLWLACNGGHIDVVNLLIQSGANVDSQDNRKVSSLMAGFRRGHVKVVKLIVRHVNQFPSDQEINRFMSLITEGDLIKKCKQCMEIIHQAKERQAAEANKHASILLQEIDQERSREETRKAAAARRREKKRQKKKEKQEQLKAKSGDSRENVVSNHSKKDAVGNKNKQKNLLANSQSNDNHNNDSSDTESSSTSDNDEDSSLIDDGESLDLLILNRDPLLVNNISKRPSTGIKQQIHQNNHQHQTNNKSNNQAKNKSNLVQIGQKNQQLNTNSASSNNGGSLKKQLPVRSSSNLESHPSVGIRSSKLSKDSSTTSSSNNNTMATYCSSQEEINTKIVDYKSRSGNIDYEDFAAPARQSSNTTLDTFSPNQQYKPSNRPLNSSSNSANTNHPNCHLMNGSSGVIIADTNTSSLTAKKVLLPKRSDEGWKEIVRKSKKVIVPASAISRVIGRGGCNINTVREVSGAHIEVEKQKGQADRGVIIKGTVEATKIAQQLIYALINEANKDLNDVIKKLGLQRPISSIPSIGVSSKYLTTNAAVSSASKSTYTNTSIQNSSPIEPVGIWNNSTAANITDQVGLDEIGEEMPVPVPEYSPFDNIFSKLTPTTVWQHNVPSVGLQSTNPAYQTADMNASLNLPRPIGEERKMLLECLNRMNMMNPYNQ